MNDKELLTLAAKAIGGLHQENAKRVGLELVTHETAMSPFWMIDGRHSHHWNPLANDGDAFRLAVKLKLLVAPCATGEVAAASMCHSVECLESLADDSRAATRRAIVRAAARIGLEMK